MRAWETVARVPSATGSLELRRRGGDFLLLENGRVLMNSHADRSERMLAELACARLRARAPRVLVSGLGMGITLRSALERLPARARVRVVEREAAVVDWCRGPLRAVCGEALADPRVEVVIGDASAALARAAEEGPRLDAALLDLSEGPAPRGLRDDPFYGPRALERTVRALAPDGVLAVWSEQPSRAFERNLTRAGLAFERGARRGPRRHTVYVATRAGARGARGLR